VSEPVASVRVAVVEPAAGAGQGGREAAGQATIEALRSLGPEIQIEIFHDAVGAQSAIPAGRVDLVIADEALGDALLALLSGLREGPPVVVVCREPGEAFALEAFRHGAADCVTASSDYAKTLPVVVLEQIRRFRAQRDRLEAERLGRRVSDLERLSENIIQNMNGGLLVVSSQGCVRFANPSAERILGAEREGLRRQPVASWMGEAAERGGCIGRTLAEGARFRGVEALIQRPDGAAVPVGVSCAPLLERDGSPDGAVVIFQDLTEIKQLQRQVLQTEKLASIGQLAAGVAHEINNPMGYIHANLCQLSEYLEDLMRVWERVHELRKAGAKAPLEPDAVRAAVAEVDRAVEEVDATYILDDFGKAIRESLEGSERIRHIVQDLRAFSHQDTAERTPADINKALDSTANIVWTMMKHSVVLTKRYEELPLVPCFPMQLKQVFMNLLVNAYQAIEERTQAHEGRGEIHLRTWLARGGVAISVTDNGRGIPPEIQDRIFDPFFTTKEVGVGTGLGLSTSYSLIQRHGGTLQVESAPGAGTTFEVWLPLGEAPGEPR